jgi:hypothetical protein
MSSPRRVARWFTPSTGNGCYPAVSYKPVIQDIPSMGGEGYGTQILLTTGQNLTMFADASGGPIPCSPSEAQDVEEVARSDASCT